MLNAQEWLDKNYPNKKTRNIYLNQQLEGVLDCGEYKKLERIFISTQVGSSELKIKKGSYEIHHPFFNSYGSDVGYDETCGTKIISCIPAQTYLDQNYPSNGTCQIKKEKSYDDDNFGKARAEITKLKIIEKGLEGSLDLSDFQNLEELWCSYDFLTSLNLNNCQKLKKLYCHANYLTQIIYPANPEKITTLSINNNNFPTSNLSIFSQFRNLESLCIGNDDKGKDKIKINQVIYNRWEGSVEPLRNLDKLTDLDINNTNISGSLEPLKDLSKLKDLDINNTDIDTGLEYLPDSLEKFECSADKRPEAQVKTIYNLFADEKGEVETEYGRIKNLPQKFQTYKQKIKAKARELLKDELQARDNQITELTKQVHELELENTQLKEDVEVAISALGAAERFGEAKTTQELHKRITELEKENQKLKETSQEQSSLQAQIEIPPKS